MNKQELTQENNFTIERFMDPEHGTWSGWFMSEGTLDKAMFNKNCTFDAGVDKFPNQGDFVGFYDEVIHEENTYQDAFDSINGHYEVPAIDIFKRYENIEIWEACNDYGMIKNSCSIEGKKHFIELINHFEAV